MTCYVLKCIKVPLIPGRTLSSYCVFSPVQVSPSKGGFTRGSCDQQTELHAHGERVRQRLAQARPRRKKEEEKQVTRLVYIFIDKYFVEGCSVDFRVYSKAAKVSLLW